MRVAQYAQIDMGAEGAMNAVTLCPLTHQCLLRDGSKTPTGGGLVNSWGVREFAQNSGGRDLAQKF